MLIDAPEICRPQTVSLMTACRRVGSDAPHPRSGRRAGRVSTRGAGPPVEPADLHRMRERGVGAPADTPGNIVPDGLFAAHEELAPGVERVQIIPKAIKITDNCFASSLFTRTKLGRVGELKIISDSSLPRS